MAKITELVELTRAQQDSDCDWLVVVDSGAGVTKKMYIDSLLGDLDGDQLDIDFTPSYYVPATTPAEADDVDDLAAHLYGIDQQLVGFRKVAYSSSFTLGVTYKYVEAVASLGAMTLTLPSAATAGAGFNYVFKVTNATNKVTLATNGAETIEGLNSFVMSRTDEVLEIISDGTNWKIIRHDRQHPSVDYVRVGRKDADELYIYPGCVALPGNTQKEVYWKATISHTVATVGTSGWHYLYIDDSTITTDRALDSGSFVVSQTKPTWSTTWGGWYNGSDKCIFVFPVKVANTIYDFHMSGRDVLYDAPIAIQAATAIANTSWVTRPCSGGTPCSSFTVGTYITFQCNTNASATGIGYWYVRPGASTGAGHHMGISRFTTGDSTMVANVNMLYMAVESVGIDYMCDDNDVNHTLAIDVNGYRLPDGM